MSASLSWLMLSLYGIRFRIIDSLSITSEIALKPCDKDSPKMKFIKISFQFRLRIGSGFRSP